MAKTDALIDMVLLFRRIGCRHHLCAFMAMEFFVQHMLVRLECGGGVKERGKADIGHVDRRIGEHALRLGVGVTILEIDFPTAGVDVVGDADQVPVRLTGLASQMIAILTFFHAPRMSKNVSSMEPMPRMPIASMSVFLPRQAMGRRPDSGSGPMARISGLALIRRFLKGRNGGGDQSRTGE